MYEVTCATNYSASHHHINFIHIAFSEEFMLASKDVSVKRAILFIKRPRLAALYSVTTLLTNDISTHQCYLQPC